MKKYAFGVDIGGTTCKVGFFETSGKLLDKWEIDTDKSNGGANILPNVAKAIEGKLAKDGISKDDIEGVGVGIPGPVDSEGNVSVCVNLGWGAVKVASELEKLTGFKAAAGNDANVAALGEMWQGGGKGTKNMVMVTLGTGVGGGVIVDGHLVAGVHGAGGEIGHITVNKNETARCNCGKCGCLEQYASATGFARMTKKKLAETSEASSLRNIADPIAKDLFDEAKKGDKLAIEIMEEQCDVLGSTLANISAVVDPEVIVLGGGVSKAGEILTSTVKKYFNANAFSACKGTTRVEIASLGNDAGMYGCAKLVIDRAN